MDAVAQALLATAFVSLLFTTSRLHSTNALLFICTCTSFITVNCAVSGLLLAWDCNLDPVTMVCALAACHLHLCARQVTLLMSVSFSVDYLVHAGHHLAHLEDCSDDHQREQLGGALQVRCCRGGMPT